MDTKPCHKTLAQQIVKALDLAFVRGMQPQDTEDLVCNDTDSVQYFIMGVNQKVAVYMVCVDLQKIWQYCHKYLKQTYYQDIPIRLGVWKDRQALEMVIDNETLTAYTKNFKDVKESGILTGKKKFDPIFGEISKRLACIKRHFFASPFEMMLIAAKNNFQGKPNNMETKSFSFYTKPDRKEKVWLAFEKNQFTVYYGINFEDRFEQQLARIYFSELVDARKHVHNAPSVSVSESELSEFLINSFPEEKKEKYTFSNGIVALTMYGKLIKNPQTVGTFLSSFRNYSYYHIQASKCYLHSRVLRRINHFHKDLVQSEIEVGNGKK